MKKKRILVLMHSDLVPPEGAKLKFEDRLTTPWTTEFDVLEALNEMGHEVLPLGVYSDLSKIKNAIEEFKPHIVFNLLEEFDGESVFDSHVVSYLELLRIPYTGCNPRGLLIARDKALSKKIMTFHRIKCPKFAVYPKNKPIKKLPKNLTFPVIVKCLAEEASLGISKASVVHNQEKLQERIKYIHTKFGVDAIIEEFIPGREFYIGVLGNYRLDILPVWEVFYSKSDSPEKEFYSRSAKWNEKYRQRKGIDSNAAKLSPELAKKIQGVAKKTYKALDLSGYARIDVRMDEHENVFVIEANPNPNIAYDDEFNESAEWGASWKYHEVLNKILSLGLSWSPTE